MTPGNHLFDLMTFLPIASIDRLSTVCELRESCFAAVIIAPASFSPKSLVGCGLTGIIMTPRV
jgi:hypothetical protein